MAVKELFNSQVKVVNIGLESFKNALDEAGAPAVQVQWKPPADVSAQAMRIIAAKKSADRKGQQKGDGHYPARHAPGHRPGACY